MPTYEYVCDACDHAFDLFQQMTAPVKKKCPECGRLKLRRLIGTGSGVLFKGAGFYETDYRSDSYKKAAKEASSDGKKKSEGDGTKKTKTDTTSTSSSSSSTSSGSGATAD